MILLKVWMFQKVDAMKGKRIFVLLSISTLICGAAFIGKQTVCADDQKDIEQKEDLEIIENLEFLDNLDIFEEDLNFFENYEGIDQSDAIGENDG